MRNHPEPLRFDLSPARRPTRPTSRLIAEAWRALEARIETENLRQVSLKIGFIAGLYAASAAASSEAAGSQDIADAAMKIEGQSWCERPKSIA